MIFGCQYCSGIKSLILAGILAGIAAAWGIYILGRVFHWGQYKLKPDEELIVTFRKGRKP